PTTLEACAFAKSRVGTRQPTGEPPRFSPPPEAARPARTSFLFCQPPKRHARPPPRGQSAHITAPVRVPTVSTVYDCANTEERRDGLAAAASAVKSGRLVVMPTDTVYGIGCDAFDSTAVASLLTAKGRGRDMPVGVLVGSWS